MPQIPASEFHAVPLRVHAFMEGVPLHDVWAVDLPRLQEPVTLGGLRRRAFERRSTKETPAPVRALFALRFFLGRIFGLERRPKGADEAAFAGRLTAQDRARSSTAAGVGDGLFDVVYRFENELLLELHNRTVHAALSSALVETADGCRFYLAIYVCKGGWLTRAYMALIDPFRRWIIYPAMLKDIRASWPQP